MTNSTQTLTLPDFLLARLDEDEAVAGATRDSHDPLDWTNYTEAPAVGLEGPVDGPSGYSSLVIDPARVLAEVEAKRRVLNECSPAKLQDYDESASALADAVLRHLALPYADHPDFREEWA